MKYSTENLVVHPYRSNDPNVIVSVVPEEAGWKYIHFQSRRLSAGKSWSFCPNGFEVALVVLSGTLDVISNRGTWHEIGKRENVFAGLP